MNIKIIYKIKNHKLKFILLILILFFVSIIFYSFYETNFIITKRYIKINNTSIKNYKIVFISDLHIGGFSGFHLKYRDEKLLKIIEKEKPDLILIGGDISSYRNTENQYEPFLLNLSKIAPVVIIYGNWDYYSGFARNKEKIKLEKISNGRIKILQNDMIIFNVNGSNLCIYGIDWLNPDNKTLIKKYSSCSYVISLIHTPEYIDFVKNYSNLVLAGHTHGGQIVLPFIGPLYYPVKEKYRKYMYGVFNISKKTMLVVTRGIGTSGIPLRFLCPPEVVVIEFN